MSPRQNPPQVEEEEALEALFDLDVREATVVAPGTGANTISCKETCGCATGPDC
jgi:hypothetical protein